MTSTAQHPPKRPERTCIACRSTGEKRALLRFVRGPKGVVSFDKSGKMPGRGAYLCAKQACFDKLAKTKLLERALRVQLNDDDYARLASDLIEQISEVEKV